MSVRQVSRPSLRRSASIRPSCSSAIIAARTLKSSRSSKAAIPISVLSSGDQLVSRCSKTLSSTEGWSVTTALTVSVRHGRLLVPQHQPVGWSPTLLAATARPAAADTRRARRRRTYTTRRIPAAASRPMTIGSIGCTSCWPEFPFRASARRIGCKVPRG